MVWNVCNVLCYCLVSVVYMCAIWKLKGAKSFVPPVTYPVGRWGCRIHVHLTLGQGKGQGVTSFLLCIPKKHKHEREEALLYFSELHSFIWGLHRATQPHLVSSKWDTKGIGMETPDGRTWSWATTRSFYLPQFQHLWNGKKSTYLSVFVNMKRVNICKMCRRVLGFSLAHVSVISLNTNLLVIIF